MTSNDSPLTKRNRPLPHEIEAFTKRVSDYFRYVESTQVFDGKTVVPSECYKVLNWLKEIVK